MPPAATNPKELPPPPDREFRGPPEEEFWERYNRRLEFPLGTAIAVLIHVAVAAFAVFLFVRLMDKGGDKSAVPVKLIEPLGMDDAGDGSAGSGGQDDPTTVGENQFLAKADTLPTLEQLDKVKEQLKVVLDDPAGSLPIAAANAAG